MIDNFSRCFELTMGIEGGFTDDPRDPGNWTGGKRNKGTLKGTKFGISAASYPHLDIKNLTLQDAKNIYKADYWDAVRGDEMPKGLDFILWDIAVNHGPHDAKVWLQAAIGAASDGIIGPRTMKRLATKNVEDVIKEVCALRANNYARLKAVSVYGKGWYRRLTSTLVDAIDMSREPTLDQSKEAPKASGWSFPNLFRRIA